MQQRQDQAPQRSVFSFLDGERSTPQLRTSSKNGKKQITSAEKIPRIFRRGLGQPAPVPAPTGAEPPSDHNARRNPTAAARRRPPPSATSPPPPISNLALTPVERM